MVGGLKYENKRLRTRWYSFNSLYTTKASKELMNSDNYFVNIQ